MFKNYKAWSVVICLIALVGTTVSGNVEAMCGHGALCNGQEPAPAQSFFPDIAGALQDVEPKVEELDWNDKSDWIIPNKYVIDFEDDLDEEEINEVLGAVGLTSKDGPYWEETKFEIAVITNDNNLRYIQGHDEVEGVEPLTRMVALGVTGLSPNDPLYEKQWHMKQVGVESAWKLSVGRGVTVAVIDTGVACDNYSHFHKASDLAQTECVPGYNFIGNNTHANDDHMHGTHVAGTIAQSTNNKIGGVGVAFGVKIMPVKVLSASGSGDNAGVAAGIRWAADNGAQVLNLSLGGGHNSAVIQRAVNHAHSKGVVVIAAAGNSGGSVGYPAGCDNVVAVSATDQQDKLASFSSRGPQVDIGAPGVSVVQNTICDNGRNNCEDFPALNGTSMATPHVAGAAALLVGQGINDPDAIESILQASAKELDTSKKGREYFGAGRLQADNAVMRTHWIQAFGRGLLLLLLSFLTFRWARVRGGNRTYSVKSPEFWVAGVLTGVGAFFAPLLLSRHQLWADIISRPVGDWSILIDANLHRYLPFATVLVPLAVAGLFLKSHLNAGKWIGGVFVGTAAYATSVVILGNFASPFGWTVNALWCLANAALCVYVGSLVLVRPSVVPPKD